MAEKEKNLLLQDLCARLPYGVIVKYKSQEGEGDVQLGCGNIGYVLQLGNGWWKECKPYLRSMSSMTEEEIVKYCELLNPYEEGDEIFAFYEAHDFLNSIHVDYRGLIKKDLALPALEGMYK